MSAEKRARELLAAELEKSGRFFAATCVREGRSEWPADDAVNAVLAALTPQWEPISTAPRDGTWILLARPGHDEVLLGYWHRTHNAWWGQGGTGGTWKKWQEATKWLPVPAPPEGE